MNIRQINFLHQKTRGYNEDLEVEIRSGPQGTIVFSVFHVTHQITPNGDYKIYSKDDSKILDEGRFTR